MSWDSQLGDITFASLPRIMTIQDIIQARTQWDCCKCNEPVSMVKILPVIRGMELTFSHHNEQSVIIIPEVAIPDVESAKTVGEWVNRITPFSPLVMPSIQWSVRDHRIVIGDEIKRKVPPIDVGEIVKYLPKFTSAFKELKSAPKKFEDFKKAIIDPITKATSIPKSFFKPSLAEPWDDLDEVPSVKPVFLYKPPTERKITLID